MGRLRSLSPPSPQRRHYKRPSTSSLLPARPSPGATSTPTYPRSSHRLTNSLAGFGSSRRPSQRLQVPLWTSQAMTRRAGRPSPPFSLSALAGWLTRELQEGERRRRCRRAMEIEWGVGPTGMWVPLFVMFYLIDMWVPLFVMFYLIDM